MATKSKAPSGLSITRSGNTYTFRWKIGDSNYDAGQALQYKINGGRWTKLAIGARATSASVSNASLKNIAFKVCGKRKKENKKEYTYSAWATSKVWTATIPPAPSLTYANNSSNSGTFSWSVSTSTDSTAIFTRVESQTQLVRGAGKPSSWTNDGNKGASGSRSITEQTTDIARGNVVRWYRVRSVGNAGASAWTESSHAYGVPRSATLTAASAVKSGSTSKLTVQWNDSYNAQYPIDKITVQYAIDQPSDSALSAPSGGWSDAIEVVPTNKADKVVANVEDTVGIDECMWARVMSEHDGNSAYSNDRIAQIGRLAAPTINATPNGTTGDVQIVITEETACEAACHAIFFRPESNPSNDRIIAIFPRGTTSRTINVPEIVGATTTCFGAYAFVGTYSGLSITAQKMTSEKAIDSDIIAVAPEGVTVSEGPRDDTVRIAWEWSWTGATSAEIAWAEHEDAWESTDEPSTYEVTDTHVTSWIVAGLETGKTWHFRVRLLLDDDNDEIAGPWSPVYSYNLSGVPDRPALTLSKNVINEGDTVTARWAYSATAGQEQAYAEIVEVTYDENNDPVYGDTIAHADVGQSIEIEYDWETDRIYYMAVRVTTTGDVTTAWSDPVSLYIADPVSISVETDDFYVTEDTNVRFNRFLQAMPITVTVTGAGLSGTTVLSIVRAEDYHLYRPDDTEFEGYAGETIFTTSQTGEDPITINADDLVGYLDDGARYELVATVIDEYDQSATERIPFEVDWTHKAGVPGTQVDVDKFSRIAVITPIAPDNYVSGDVCDIYRLTADQPELIYKGAVFGTTYVDPYPGFGEMCGHRLVTRTANGDYATENGIGWYDAGAEDGDYLDEKQIIIDVDGDQIELPYNIGLSNKWNKDFKRTSYLGGSVHGDWNPAVTRDLTANTVIVRGDELDKQLSMRDLAAYAGVAHIRTPEGSSLTADIQIDESMSYDTKKVSYTLTVKAIDPQDPVGMTLAEWEEMNPPGGE